MAKIEQLNILGDGVQGWNAWRQQLNPESIDLRKADLRDADLRFIKLSHSYLTGADFSRAKLNEARFTRSHAIRAIFADADLRKARFFKADLTGCNFTGADLTDADFTGATLAGTDFTCATLNGADLSAAIMVNTVFRGAKINDCNIHGIAAWDLQTDGAEQSGLIITRRGDSKITVDNLKVAQFIYLLLNNPDIREVINTITSKVVLILGRFTPERKAVLDAVRTTLRKHNYTPVMFDFQKPENMGFTETVSVLAHMARFVIADVTEPKVVLQELQRIVPNLPSVPVQPILLAGESENVILADFRKYPWFLPTYFYEGLDDVINSMQEGVIQPAEAKAKELGR